MLIIADTSALVAISTCDGLQWLDTLFDELQVPNAVYIEAITEGKPQAEKLKRYLADKVAGTDLSELIIAAPGMGKGELEAMALYRKRKADRLLIDDLRARKVALYNNIQVVGSVGILLMAKNQGLIKAIRPHLERIQKSEVHLGDALIAEALKMAGEAI